MNTPVRGGRYIRDKKSGALVNVPEEQVSPPAEIAASDVADASEPAAEETDNAPAATADTKKRAK